MSFGATRHRRWLQFRLRTLLLLPLVFAAAWWWVTWPERTARRFVELLNAGEIEAAKAMCDAEPAKVGFWELVEMKIATFGPPKPKPQVWSDVVRPRRKFDLVWQGNRHVGIVELAAGRGRVALAKSAGPSLFLMFQISEVPASDMVRVLSEYYSGDHDRPFFAETRTNSVVVLAAPSRFDEIGALITAVDRPQEQPAKIIRPGF